MTKESENRRTEHMHALIHIVDTPKIDENEGSEAVEFIDKYIVQALPDKTKYPEMNNLVKKVSPPSYNQLQKEKSCCKQV